MDITQLDIIEDEDLNFIISEVPTKMNFIDKYRFRCMTLREIKSYVIRSFFVGNFFVVVFVSLTPKAKRIFSYLFERINFFKTILSHMHVSEVWIIKDVKYSCVGMYRGEPIFLRLFSDVYNADNNLPLIIKSMKGYTASINTICRFFGCNSEDFQYKTKNCYEYLDEQIMQYTNGQTLYEFCIDKFNSNGNFLTKARFWIIGTLTILCLIGSICTQKILSVKINQYYERSLILQETIPITYQTYMRIKAHENDEDIFIQIG